MNLKSTLLVAAAAGTITTAGLGALAPDSSHDGDRRPQQEQVDDLGRNQQDVNRRLREEGKAAMDGKMADDLRPVEPRPAEPHVRLHLPGWLP